MLKFSLAIICVTICFSVFCQNELPDTRIRDLSGRSVNFKDIGAPKDTAVIVSFWATWCIPCINELEAINDKYHDIQKEIPFKMIAISVDDARTSSRVKSFAAGKGWDFDIYLDINNDLKRALNINDMPHILIIKNGRIVYQHNGYLPGNEEELFEKLKTI